MYNYQLTWIWIWICHICKWWTPRAYLPSPPPHPHTMHSPYAPPPTHTPCSKVVIVTCVSVGGREPIVCVMLLMLMEDAFLPVTPDTVAMKAAWFASEPNNWSV